MPTPTAWICCPKCQKAMHRVELPFGRTVEDVAAGYAAVTIECPHCAAVPGANRHECRVLPIVRETEAPAPEPEPDSDPAAPTA